MKYAGGYYMLPCEIIKHGLHKHTAGLEDPVSDAMLDAVNIIQGVPWRINPFIYEWMSKAFASGDRIGGLVADENDPLPPRIEEQEWLGMSSEEKMRAKQRMSDIHGANAKRASIRETSSRKLALAGELLNAPEIYFPCALDFRGRVYPLPQDLNPQGHDTAKALLMFRDAKPIGTDGLEWLAIAVANAAGQDKVSFVDRVKWVEDNFVHLERSVEEPLDYRWWAQEGFDSPWTLLALAQELVMARKYGPTFPNHVPVAVDATCSGIQHLSALGRDPIGARATNLMDTGKREDLYSEIAEAVKQIVADDAASGNETAQAWIGNVKRSTVKRAVMTTPYGVTRMGIVSQLINDKNCAGVPVPPNTAANYMADTTIKALESTVVAAKQIMKYLQDVAKALASAGHPLMWETPMGFTVKQAYYNVNGARLRTLWGALQLWNENPAGGLSVKDQGMAAAPNVVHSLDAAHLAFTVRRAFHEQGIEAFALVHDSYGTHACDIPALGETLRECFAEMYSGDWLEGFEEAIREYAPEVELPPRPMQGPFDPASVTASPYFFS